ncbi:hypothetical protein TRVL_06414 [Trypanosoma vivax]|uniref:Uncharacterized protein n=1 Tax=Trypanosoma vivax (strain Y486) TaxID=1055687 RepID=G0U0M2_TRYVY|nr:hypothetical protein TRVL_06414 [Trypanosoma vivax]CCC49621.1 hypothetical protein, unlikely [Trypanosoma vivax Y486]
MRARNVAVEFHGRGVTRAREWMRTGTLLFPLARAKRDRIFRFGVSLSSVVTTFPRLNQIVGVVEHAITLLFNGATFINFIPFSTSNRLSSIRATMVATFFQIPFYLVVPFASWHLWAFRSQALPSPESLFRMHAHARKWGIEGEQSSVDDQVQE